MKMGLYEKKKVSNGESRIPDLWRLRSTCYLLPRQLIFVTLVKLIIFNTFAHEILPVDAVWSR